MLDDIEFSAFIGVSVEAWRGNEPHEVCDDVCKWVCKWGSATTKGDKVISAEFHLNELVCIDIHRDLLSISDNRTHSTIDFYEYCNVPECLSKSLFKSWHPLEEERIQRYLNKKIDCKLWNMVRERAIELYERGVIPLG